MKEYIKYILANYLFPGRIIWNCPNMNNIVSFTFDDGPHPEVTPRILDALDVIGAKATFFVLGKNAENHTDIIKDIINRGHEIGTHTYSHVSMKKVTYQDYLSDIKRCDDILAAQNIDVTLFRPPFGDIVWRHIPTITNKKKIILWNKDTIDYTFSDISAAWEYSSKLPILPGDIILMHDVYHHTIELVKELGKKIHKSGLQIQTISEMRL